MAMIDARKYSVPLHAAMMRELVSERPRRSKSRVYATSQDQGRLGKGERVAYRIVSDQVDTSDLLEALYYHSERGAAEVLLGTVCKKDAKVARLCGGIILDGEGLADGKISLQNGGICVRFVLECRENGKSLSIATLLCEPARRLRELEGSLSKMKAVSSK
jgi:hypothetical protein